MAQMQRQDHVALDQRKRQAADHRRRDGRHELTGDAGEEKHRDERGHRRQDPKRDGYEHAPGTLDGTGQLPGPFALRHVGGLADDHRVVDQEPENQYEADERNRVDRDA